MTEQSVSAHGFFGRLRALDRIVHQSLRIDRQAGYGFARSLLMVPLTLSDFAPAARDYPIVFVGSPAQPFALLGLRRQRNLLVGDDGHWLKGRYVPNHLRSYPFGYAETQGSHIVVCIDEAADHFSPSRQHGSEALFTDGQPSPLVNEMLDYLTRLHLEVQQMAGFAAAVAEAQLLIERKAEVTLADGERLGMDGFLVVDEAKFNALPDKTFLDWRRRGWLAAIYFHLQSMANFANLVDWASERKAAAG